MTAGSAPGPGQDPPSRRAPSRPAPDRPAAGHYAPGQRAPGFPAQHQGPSHSAPGQPAPGQPAPRSSVPGPHESLISAQDCPEPSQLELPHSAQGHSAPGQPAPGRTDSSASLASAPPASGTSDETDAWWEGDWRDEADDEALEVAEALEWADPPGEPLDEQAINAARAGSIAAEVAGSGFWRREPAGPGAGLRVRSLSGFGSGDDLDELEPGPALAGLTDTATRPARIADLDDDELIGALRAWRRLESWTAAGTLSVVAELARRRPADRTAPANPGQFPDQPSEFLTDEVAAALTLTGPGAAICLDLALDLAIRLPGTAQALRAGIIDYPRARMIAEATRILSADDARRVEALILAKAGQQTSGQLRAALARVILEIDPEAAQRRREQAQRDPRIRRWREEVGTAALAGYGLPPADVLEADQHLTERAQDLRAAGLPGTLDELRARAYLDALLGRDPTPSAEPGAASESSRPASTPPSGTHAGSAPSGAPASTEPSGSPDAAPSTEAAPSGASADPESSASSTGAAPSGPSAGTPPSTDSQPSTDTAPSTKATSSRASADPEPSAPSASAAPSTEAAPSAAPAAPTGPTGSGGRLAARINLTVP